VSRPRKPGRKIWDELCEYLADQFVDRLKTLIDLLGDCVIAVSILCAWWAFAWLTDTLVGHAWFGVTLEWFHSIRLLSVYAKPELNTLESLFRNQPKGSQERSQFEFRRPNVKQWGGKRGGPPAAPFAGAAVWLRGRERQRRPAHTSGGDSIVNEPTAAPRPTELGRFSGNSSASPELR
jgi:hypothetical protein